MYVTIFKTGTDEEDFGPSIATWGRPECGLCSNACPVLGYKSCRRRGGKDAVREGGRDIRKANATGKGLLLINCNSLFHRCFIYICHPAIFYI